MVRDLDQVLEGKPLPGVPALRESLGRLLDRAAAAATAFAGQEKLCRRVFRLRFTRPDGGRHSVIVKLLDRPTGERCENIATRWLPALGLATLPAELLATATAGDSHVWHVYENVPGEALSGDRSEAPRVAAAVDRIATLHSRSADHALLHQARRGGGDRGKSFFSVSVHAAARLLEQSSPSITGERDALRRRLLDRVNLLLEAEGRYGELLDQWGGTAVLLHGDLWPQNIVVDRRENQWAARLVDWDRCGVGPALYDLSTFLSRFPLDERAAILSLYERQIEGTRLHLPPVECFNEVAALTEGARLASCIISPAGVVAASPGKTVDWAWDELREVDEWFDLVGPLLPETSQSGVVPA